MENYTVRTHMTTELILVTADTEIRHAVHTLLSNNVGGMPVVDHYGALVGFLTERDCIEVMLQAGYHDEHGGEVSKYMSTNVRTVTPDTSLIDVAETFVTSQYHRFPVVDEDRLVGLISRHDILRALNQGIWFPHT